MTVGTLPESGTAARARPSPRAIVLGRLRIGARAATFPRGFRRGLLISVAIHGAVLGAFISDLLSPATSPPGPRVLSAALDASVTLEEESRPEEPPPPEVPPPPPEEETLLEPVEAAVDPRAQPEAPTSEPPSGSIGLASPEGWRRPVTARSPGGAGRGGREAPATVVESPPPAEPVFVPARRIADLCPAPAYPRRERDRGTAGTVRLRLEVGEDGSVREAAVETSSGSAALDAAALAAAKGWRFEPALRGSVPVATVVLQPFEFRLADAPR